MQRVAIALLLLASSAEASELVSLDANEGPVENGKTLKMEFREVERKGDESKVRVFFHSGGSVSSSMFIASAERRNNVSLPWPRSGPA